MGSWASRDANIRGRPHRALGPAVRHWRGKYDHGIDVGEIGRAWAMAVVVSCRLRFNVVTVPNSATAQRQRGENKTNAANARIKTHEAIPTVRRKVSMRQR